MSDPAAPPEIAPPAPSDLPPGAERIGRSIRLPPPTARGRAPGPAPIIVQARIRLDGRHHFILAGTAAPAIDHSGRHLLCILVEAMPANRRLYLPLQDVLVLAAEGPADMDLDLAEPRGHA